MSTGLTRTGVGGEDLGEAVVGHFGGGAAERGSLREVLLLLLESLHSLPVREATGRNGLGDDGTSESRA